jgi:hypothetical protein
MPVHEHQAGVATTARPLGRKSAAELKAIFKLRKEVARMQGRAAPLEIAIAAMRHGIEALETAITDVEVQIGLAEGKMPRTRRLRRQLRGLEDRRPRLQLKLAQIEAKLARRQARIARLEEALAALEVPRPDRLVTRLVGTGRHYQQGTKIVVTEGTSVSDSARLRGGFTEAAEGTIEYDVYSDKACTKLLTAAGVVSVSRRAAPESSPLTLPVGKYYWRAFYSGDKLNLPSMSSCAEVETVIP